MFCRAIDAVSVSTQASSILKAMDSKVPVAKVRQSAETARIILSVG